MLILHQQRQMAFSLCCVNSDIWLLLNAYQPQTLKFQSIFKWKSRGIGV